MAIDIGAVLTRRVDFGSAAMLDNLPQGTLIAWLYYTGFDGYFASKVVAGSWNFEWYTTAGGLPHRLDFWRVRAGVDLRLAVNAWASQNDWQFFGASWDSTGANGDQKMVRGTLTSLAVEPGVYAIQQVGNGALGDDSAENLQICNAGVGAGWSALSNTPYAIFGVWNTNLSVGQMQSLQFYPRPTPGCVLFCHLGFNGAVASQPDWSGNANNGTPSAGCVVADHVPLGPPFGFDLETAGIWVAAAPPVGIPIFRRRIENY